MPGRREKTHSPQKEKRHSSPSRSRCHGECAKHRYTSHLHYTTACQSNPIGLRDHVLVRAIFHITGHRPTANQGAAPLWAEGIRKRATAPSLARPDKLNRLKFGNSTNNGVSRGDCGAGVLRGKGHSCPKVRKDSARVVNQVKGRWKCRMPYLLLTPMNVVDLFRRRFLCAYGSFVSAIPFVV
jgi:hypothetical protein